MIQANKDIIHRKLHGQSADHSGSEDLFLSSPPGGSVTDSDEVFQLYTRFIENSNYVDLCDVFTSVQKELETNEVLQKEISTANYIVFGNPVGEVEVRLGK